MKLGIDRAASQVLILFVVIGVSLPMAWISMAKLALFTYALITLLFWSHYREQWEQSTQLWAIRIMIIGVAAFGLSLVWTIAPMDYALHGWLKHAKLLTVLFLLVLLNTESRARLAIRWFIFAQGIVLLLSWLIALGVPIPSNSAPNMGPVVFTESYIDQSAMFCVSGALAWHLRDDCLWPRWISFAMPLFAALNIMLLLAGRSGYFIAIALICASTYWGLPRRFRLLITLAAPMLLFSVSLLLSTHFRAGIERAVTESVSFIHQTETKTSSGWRLNAWHRSTEAIVARPLAGYGVGSFVPAVSLFETTQKDEVFGTSLSSNPHQEFLLWGVELGYGGILLLVSFLTLIVRSALNMPAPTQRSVISVVITIGIACLFNSALYDDLIGDFLCIALGLCMAYGVNQTRASNRYVPREETSP